jgi:hypothetical protein
LRAAAALLLLLTAHDAVAQDIDPAFPLGYFWNCSATMEGADGRFSGSLNVEEDGTRNLGSVEWTSSQTFHGVDYGPKGDLSLRAMWWAFDPGRDTFDLGTLYLIYEAEKNLPRFGYFDFGEGPDGGTFVTSFRRNDPDRKTALAQLRFRSLKRWTAGNDVLLWRMQGGEDGVASGKWVTSGVLPMAFVPRLEADLERFRSQLIDKAARPEAECTKVAREEETIII